MAAAPTSFSTVSGTQSANWVLPSAVPQGVGVVITALLPTPFSIQGGLPATLQAGTIYFGESSVAGNNWTPVNPASERPTLTLPSASSPSTSDPSTASNNTSTPSQNATTDTSSTTPTTSGQPIQSDGLSGGAVAGVAIGCLVAGLLLGALIAYIFFGRRRKQTPVPVYAPVQYDSQEKQGAAVVASSPQHQGEQLDKFLLDSRPDRDIAGEARSLNLLIQQHVENYYHLHPVQQDSNALAQVLVDLGLGVHQGSSMGPVHLTTLALDPRTRHAALRHIIAHAALNASFIHNTGPISLLPQSVGTFTRGIPPVEAHRGSTQAVETALTRWRQLSAFLLNPNRSERTSLVPTEDVSTQQAQQLSTALNRFVGAFASRDREELYEQENHLREVIVECAAFGYVLFSQPAEFYLIYQDGHKSQKHGGIVTFPGLDKIRNESGQKYPSPITVAAPVLER